ncbi:hypothetical protein ATE92_0224 [Ulvibacter sp. MAR_2010_11]|nr:hypothetical protein ATE92_0224 [Ulvibacter sp. MAR_2010_11]
MCKRLSGKAAQNADLFELYSCLDLSTALKETTISE